LFNHQAGRNEVLINTIVDFLLNWKIKKERPAGRRPLRLHGFGFEFVAMADRKPSGMAGYYLCKSSIHQELQAAGPFTNSK
jgi:hypothetical protein